VEESHGDHADPQKISAAELAQALLLTLRREERTAADGTAQVTRPRAARSAKPLTQKFQTYFNTGNPVDYGNLPRARKKGAFS
jgi:hypothetical protein